MPHLQGLPAHRHNHLMNILCGALRRCRMETTREPHLASLRHPPRDAAEPNRVPNAGEALHARQAARSACPSGTRSDNLSVLYTRMCVLNVSVVTAAVRQVCACLLLSTRPFQASHCRPVVVNEHMKNSLYKSQENMRRMRESACGLGFTAHERAAFLSHVSIDRATGHGR
jgi:hypothetical protein